MGFIMKVPPESIQAPGIKTIPSALYFQPGKVWSRVNSFLQPLPCPFLSTLAGILTELGKTWPSHSVMIAFFAAWSANCLPFIVWVSPLWCPGRGIMATCEGLWAASDSGRISAVWFVSLVFEVRKPLSFQITSCTYTAKNAERGSVYMFTHFPSAAETVLVRAMTYAYWAELPGDRFYFNTPLWGISAYPAHHLPGPWSCSHQWTPPTPAQPRVGLLSLVCWRTPAPCCVGSNALGVVWLPSGAMWLDSGLRSPALLHWDCLKRTAWYFPILPEVSQ